MTAALKFKSAGLFWKLNCSRTFLLLVIPLFLFFSCASSPKNEIPEVDYAEPEASQEQSQASENENLPAQAEEISDPLEQLEEVVSESDFGSAIIIPLPPKKDDVSFFNSVQKSILDDVENGSPVSLKNAIINLRKKGINHLEEKEKILLCTASGILNIVWPGESLGYEDPECDRSNAYLGAIDSVKKGIYDLSSGNTDFLTLVLPSLVLVTSISRNDYFDQAEESLRKGLNLVKDSVLANYLYGTLLLKRGDFSDAVQYFETAEKGSPGNKQILYKLSLSYRNCHRWKESLEYAELLLKDQPHNVDYLKLCAENSWDLENISKAEDYVTRVLLQQPENTEYVLFRAKILMEKKDYIKAASLLDVYARTDRNNRDYLLLRSRLQREWNKNNTAAGVTIEQALNLYPDDLELIEFAADLANSAEIVIGGRTALSFAEELLFHDPDNVKALHISLNEKVKEKKWEEGYKISSGIIRNKNLMQNSEYALDVIYSHIDICLALKKFDEAYKLALGQYSQNQNDEDAQKSYVKVLVALGRKSEALNIINSLLPDVTSRTRSFLYYQRSLIDTREEEVLSDLRSSLTSNPRNIDSLYRLYEIYYRKKEWRKAQYYLKQVVALHPGDSEMLRKNAELDALLNK